MQEFGRLVVLTGGLLAVMPLLLVITLAVAIERFYLLKKILREGHDIHNRLRRVAYQNIAGLQAIADDTANTLQGRLVATAIVSRGETAEAMEMHLEEEIMAATPKISRLLWVLDTAVTIAPLLGLFGTIIGMVQAFNVLSVNGGATKVTGGIADALVSTGAGLLIAIIAVYFVNYFNNLTRRIMHQLELIKLILINRVHGKGLGAATQRPSVSRVGA
ncbi:MAG TPA: MotA/TolQ/ExbB proton channel family protein [Acidocella sp.]|jgi:biopolymer transport protein ExbB|uniref:MotA/TolQ/ExbB proton channel family protein n=1 Tax=Acidocella sp. TaxID=50710 RepID=UPI002C565E0A|nr:MotA/TolQ/ExbB proton channel family protein [Acidocella sp.]HVE21001.1 MotA/TolQ/ExbB proton channel family protein [Acidocella sp.]